MLMSTKVTRGRLTKTMDNTRRIVMGGKGEMIYKDLKGLVSHDFQLVNEIGSIDGFPNGLGKKSDVFRRPEC